MNSDQHHCVIVGAGHSAAQLCVSLTKESWNGQITLFGNEPCLPYHRPPLSKTQLAVEDTEPLLLIRPEEFYREHNVEIRHEHVTRIDRNAKTIHSGDQSTPYDTLVLSTGSIPNRPPIDGIDHAKVFQLYTAAHAEEIRSQIRTAKRVVIIGAGFIGLEVASSLRKQNIEVTVLELSERILSRVTSPEVSQWFEDLHRSHGVDLRTGVSAKSIFESGDQLTVTSSEGSEFVADFVVIGTGALPNDQLAKEAGLDVENGVTVNEFNQTSDADVYAMGDCCNQLSSLFESRLRLESVQNATDQAKTVAKSIIGDPTPNIALPWFWSDQYDAKLQIAGISTGYDNHVVRHSTKPNRSFSVWYFKENRLIAVDAINDARSYMAASRMIPKRRCPDIELVADPNSDLKAIMNSGKEVTDGSPK